MDSVCCHNKKKINELTIAVVVGLIIGGIVGFVLFGKSYKVQLCAYKVVYKLNPSAYNLFCICDKLRDSNSDEYEKYYNELLKMEDSQIEDYQANPTTENLFYLCDFLVSVKSKRCAQFCHTLVNRQDFDEYSSCSNVYDKLNTAGDETSSESDKTSYELFTVRDYYLVAGIYCCIYWKDADRLAQEIEFVNKSDTELASIVPFIYTVSNSCDNGFFAENSMNIVNSLCESVFEQIEANDNFFNNRLCKDELLFILSYYENRDNQGLKYSKTELEDVYSVFLKGYSDMYDDELLQEEIFKDKSNMYDYRWYWSGLLGAWE